MDRLDDTARAAFRRYRAAYPRIPAHLALERARTDRAGVYHVTGSGGGGTLDKKPARWFDRVREIPWRQVRYADDVVRLSHRGWFTDEFQDSTLRGIIALLPRGRYLAGYEETDGGQVGFQCHAYDDEDEAARAADNLAERVAERERDYNAAWAAGRIASEKVQEAMDAWRVAVRRACWDLWGGDSIFRQYPLTDDERQDRHDEMAVHRETLTDALRDAWDARPAWSGSERDAFDEGFAEGFTVPPRIGRVRIPA
jgi:hypothetical protein